MNKVNFSKLSTISEGFVEQAQGRAKKGGQELDKQLHELTMQRLGPKVPLTEAEKKMMENPPSPVPSVKFKDLAGYIKKA